MMFTDERCFRVICTFFVLLVPCLASSFTHLYCQNGGDPCFAHTARDFSMGGTLQHTIGEAPALETSFCITHHENSSSEGDDSFSLWAIPYFSLSFPAGGSIFGFRRNCAYDYNYRLTTSEGVIVSSGALWSNSIWWNHTLFSRASLNLEVGILTGEIINSHGSHPYLFVRKERVSRKFLRSSLALTQEFGEAYGGIRYCGGDEYPPQFWIGLRKEISSLRNGRVEVVYHPAGDSIRRNSNSPEFHFGVEEKISEVVRLRYGFAAMPSPSLFCLTLGCGLSRGALNVDTALGYYFFENENVVQLMITVTAELWEEK